MDLRRQAEGGGRLRRRQLNTEHTTGGIWSSRYLAVTVANLTVVAIAAFDGLAVASALPSIADDLGRIALLPWVLTEIQSGQFADEWIAESESGRADYHRMQEEGKAHPIEVVGSHLRAMMPWISAGKQKVADASGGAS